MGKSSKSLFIGALASTMVSASAMVSGVASAADYIPPPVIDFEPEFEFGGNLYLRGYVGFTNQEVDSIYNSDFTRFDVVEVLNSEFESGGLAGLAIGYRVNEWFRGDISAEYRMRAGYNGLDRTDGIGGGAGFDGTNFYTANKSEFLVMANAFVDLGTYHGITPYVGAGLGATYTTISNFSDVNEATAGVAFADDNSEWALAWALHAGLGYEVNDRLTLDFGYRYLHLGDAASGDFVTFDGVNERDNPLEFRDLSSHDFTLGFRWDLGSFGGGHGGGFGQLTY